MYELNDPLNMLSYNTFFFKAINSSYFQIHGTVFSRQTSSPEVSNHLVLEILRIFEIVKRIGTKGCARIFVSALLRENYSTHRLK